jgi:hypothetical protein
VCCCCCCCCVLAVLVWRQPGEVARGCIEGAANFPLSTLRTKLHELPKDKRIYVYCQVGAVCRRRTWHVLLLMMLFLCSALAWATLPGCWALCKDDRQGAVGTCTHTLLLFVLGSPCMYTTWGMFLLCAMPCAGPGQTHAGE